jgi:SP family myo-inositol transporter-like MFS transporter 13
MEAITPAGAFGLYGGFCFIGWLFCLLCYPETFVPLSPLPSPPSGFTKLTISSSPVCVLSRSGLSLEEVFQVFENDFGIKRSEQIRADKAAIREGTAYRA